MVKSKEEFIFVNTYKTERAEALKSLLSTYTMNTCR